MKTVRACKCGPEKGVGAETPIELGGEGVTVPTGHAGVTWGAQSPLAMQE